MNTNEKNGVEFVGDPNRRSLLFSLLRRISEKQHGTAPTSSGGEQKEVLEEGDESRSKVVDESMVIPKPAPPAPAPLPLTVFRRKWLEETNEPHINSSTILDFTETPEPEHLETKLKEIGIQVWSKLSRYKHLRDGYSKALQAYTQQMAERHSDRSVLEKITGPELEEEPEAPVEPGLDGELIAIISPDSLVAWCMHFPALGRGVPLTRETLGAALEKAGIYHGAIEEKLDDLLAYPLRLFEIAHASLAVDGEDGRLDECFSREIGTPQFVENERGIVDFKELNWLTRIEKGTVVAHIIEPTEGIEGKDVRGNSLPARAGQRAVAIPGNNIGLNEAKTALVAKLTGQISFRDGRFEIDDVIVIPGNIDLSTGNLKVHGNVIIRGNILAGFSVHTTGDLMVEGLVEGSAVSAGGNIVVRKGMNGNLTGSLTAGGSIHCKYMENASVRAIGDIFMESIVNCQVISNSRVMVRSGRGAIIGGSVWAMTKIEATTAGNKAGRGTSLNIAVTSLFRSEWAKLEKEYDETLAALQRCTAPILSSIKKEKEAPAKKQEEEALASKVAELEATVQVLRQKMEEMRAREDQVEQGQILADTMHPGTMVSIVGQNKTIVETIERCRVFLGQDGIKVTHR